MKPVRLAVWIGASIFFCAWQRIQATRLSFELEQRRRAVLEAKSRNSYLRLELQNLHSPESLAASARQHLGMLPPTADSLIVLGENHPRKNTGPTLLSWLAPSLRP